MYSNPGTRYCSEDTEPAARNALNMDGQNAETTAIYHEASARYFRNVTMPFQMRRCSHAAQSRPPLVRYPPFRRVLSTIQEEGEDQADGSSKGVECSESIDSNEHRVFYNA